MVDVCPINLDLVRLKIAKLPATEHDLLCEESKEHGVHSTLQPAMSNLGWLKSAQIVGCATAESRVLKQLHYR